MSSDPGERAADDAVPSDEHFVVPVPGRAEAPPTPVQSDGTSSAATQEVRINEPTRELPTLPPPPAATAAPAAASAWAAPSAAPSVAPSAATAPAGSAWPAPSGPAIPGPPPVPANPYAGQPIWPPGVGGQPTRPAPAPRASTSGVEEVDPLLAQIGSALFWITVGWWVFFLIRLIGWFTRYGVTGTMVIHTIDLGAEETIIAAVLSVLAALLLLLGRGRNGRTPLGYASAALAVVTVAVAVWRLVP